MGDFLKIDTDALTGMALALKNVDRDARKEWAAAMRGTGNQLWRSSISKLSAPRKQWQKMYRTASIRWSMGGKGAAIVNIRPLSGGLDQWPVLEFGGPLPQIPPYNRSGHVAYYAVRRLGPYMGAMALKTTADLIRDATGGS